jgi:Mrp family chromosome partitioning ATPase
MFDRLNIPIIGLIDNMSYSISTDTNEHIPEFNPANLELDIGLKVLGEIPRTRELTDFNPNKSSIFFKTIYNEVLKII